MPTVVADVDPQARLAQEEIFGSVSACISTRFR
jgi:acyl-CoA reductase-like NAD-dependent aldehyde dehydrogenase